MRPAAFGASIAALAVSTGSLLVPQAASAIDFTFSFAGVTGLITGLVEGANPCGATSSCRVSIVNPGTSMAPIGVYPANVSTVGRAGFTVSGGGASVVAADWGVLSMYLPDSGSFLEIRGDGLNGVNTFIGYLQMFDAVEALSGEEVGELTFALVRPVPPPSDPASVPGPLPLFGAAAALGFSRKLRNRIKSRKLPVTSAIN